MTPNTTENKIFFSGLYEKKTPVLARFLNADPVIQAPGNAQNYNSYSYCFNNPLSFTDPSGYANRPILDDGDDYIEGRFKGSYWDGYYNSGPIGYSGRSGGVNNYSGFGDYGTSYVYNWETGNYEGANGEVFAYGYIHDNFVENHSTFSVKLTVDKEIVQFKVLLNGQLTITTDSKDGWVTYTENVDGTLSNTLIGGYNVGNNSGGGNSLSFSYAYYGAIVPSGGLFNLFNKDTDGTCTGIEYSKGTLYISSGDKWVRNSITYNFNTGVYNKIPYDNRPSIKTAWWGMGYHMDDVLGLGLGGYGGKKISFWHSTKDEVIKHTLDYIHEINKINNEVEVWHMGDIFTDFSLKGGTWGTTVEGKFILDNETYPVLLEFHISAHYNKAMVYYPTQIGSRGGGQAYKICRHPHGSIGIPMIIINIKDDDWKVHNYIYGE